MLNFDFKVAREKRFLQLCELVKLRLKAYESSCIYKERTKQWHDKDIMKKRFEEGDLVISFNSRLKLFSKKLRSFWWGPFKFTKVQPNGAVEVWNESIEAFIVNRQQLKPYFMG